MVLWQWIAVLFIIHITSCPSARHLKFTMAPIGTVWFTGPCIILASMQIKRMSIKMNHILICFIKSFLVLSESYSNCSWIQLNCSMLHHCLDEINANTLLDTYKCKDLLFSRCLDAINKSKLILYCYKDNGSTHGVWWASSKPQSIYAIATAVGISYQRKENSPAQLSPTTLHTCE